MNVIETIQKNLGYESLQKINPNVQDVDHKLTQHGNAALAQAGIPTVLIGLFNQLEKTPDASWLAGDQPTGAMLEKIFGKSAPMVVEKVGSYAGNADSLVKQELEHIASESVRVVRDSIKDLTKEDSIVGFVAKNKQEVMSYLPASLRLGTLLGNNNLDDRTNKMEGPISSLMHKIENQFNSSGKN